MKPLASSRLAIVLFAAAGLTAVAQPAKAQSTGDMYIGLSAGRTAADIDCGTALYSCDRHDTSYKLTLGRHFAPFLGGEVSVLQGGKAARGGGTTSMEAADAFLIGRLPVGPLQVFAKGGLSYSHTDTSSGVLSGLTDGTASGWAPAYGVGVSVDVLPSVSVVAELERRRMEFAGEGRQNVDNTSLGLRYKF